MSEQTLVEQARGGQTPAETGSGRPGRGSGVHALDRIDGMLDHYTRLDEDRDEPREGWNEAESAGARQAASVRRRELAGFLRSRRERIMPEQVGLPPAARRRTPGLRREEVATLAGVGVT